jgi:ferritin
MLTDSMQKALNEQINKELYSSYLYLSMSACADSMGLPGVAHWLMMQVQEESLHAMKLYDYVQQKGGRVQLDAIDAPPREFGTPQQIFEETLKHEQKVTASINELMDTAIDERDHATQIFLQWFVTEQVEEEAGVQEIIDQCRLAGEHQGNLMMIDQRLAQRPAPTVPAQ